METLTLDPNSQTHEEPRGHFTDEYGAYLPTKAQIAWECRRIQQTWSPREKRKRNIFGRPAQHWDPPTCKVAKIA